MSDEHFLARWSRLKREQAAQSHPQPADAQAPHASATESDATSPVSAENAVAPPEPPLPELPALAAIGPDTDIRAFLSAGVPADLTRAALRTAWAADPAIRDFVGLAENSWDFNAPETIPGFAGPLSSSDSMRLVRLFNPPEAEDADASRGPRESSDGVAASEAQSAPESAQHEASAQAQPGADAEPAGRVDAQPEQPATMAQAREPIDEGQGGQAPQPVAAPAKRRSHGGAVPQ